MEALVVLAIMALGPLTTPPTPNQRSAPGRWRPSPGSHASWSMKSPAPLKQKPSPRSLGMRRETARRLNTASIVMASRMYYCNILTNSQFQVFLVGMATVEGGPQVMLLASVRRRPRKFASRCQSRRSLTGMQKNAQELPRRYACDHLVWV